MPTIKTSFRWCIIHMIGIIDRVVFFGIIGISHKRRAIRLFPGHAIFRPCKTLGAAKIILCSRTTDGRKEYNQPDRKMPVLLPLFFFYYNRFHKNFVSRQQKNQKLLLLVLILYTFKTTHRNLFLPSESFLPNTCWLSLRPISISQLHTLLHFHLWPIYLVVFKGSYRFRMGYLILRGASRLDAFSVYPFPTWLPGYAPGGTTGAPEVSPSRSSRTKDSSSQISCAHAG